MSECPISSIGRGRRSLGYLLSLTLQHTPVGVSESSCECGSEYHIKGHEIESPEQEEEKEFFFFLVHR